MAGWLAILAAFAVIALTYGALGLLLGRYRPGLGAATLSASRPRAPRP